MSDWANGYLDDAKRRCSKKTYDEKRSTFRRLASFCGGNRELTIFTPSFALAYLQRQFDSRSGYAANKDRKNPQTAWEWGRKYLSGFHVLANPFSAVERFPEERQPRYVPPDEKNFWKVHDVAVGQDKVMLTAFLYLAARRGEIFRLKWSDVDFHKRMVRLSTKKTRDGSMRYD